MKALDALPVDRKAIAGWIDRHSRPTWFGTFIEQEADARMDVVIVSPYPSATAVDRALEHIRDAGKSGTVWVAVTTGDDGKLAVASMAGHARG